MNAMQILAAPRRRQILRAVWSDERSAGEIHRAVSDVSFGAISQHLRVLREGGLVTSRAAGRRRYYRARKEALGPLCAWLEAMWADALAELKLRAELEEARRGPRPRRRPPRTWRRRR